MKNSLSEIHPRLIATIDPLTATVEERYSQGSQRRFLPSQVIQAAFDFRPHPDQVSSRDVSDEDMSRTMEPMLVIRQRDQIDPACMAFE